MATLAAIIARHRGERVATSITEYWHRAAHDRRSKRSERQRPRAPEAVTKIVSDGCHLFAEGRVAFGLQSTRPDGFRQDGRIARLRILDHRRRAARTRIRRPDQDAGR